MAACSTLFGHQLEILNKRGQHWANLQQHFLEQLKLSMLCLHKSPTWEAILADFLGFKYAIESSHRNECYHVTDGFVHSYIYSHRPNVTALLIKWLQTRHLPFETLHHSCVLLLWSALALCLQQSMVGAGPHRSSLQQSFLQVLQHIHLQTEKYSFNDCISDWSCHD